MSIEYVALLIVAYLLGSLPWALWLGKVFFQTDVRTVGDGNPGAANAFRVGGWPLGVAVLLLDFLKAFAAVAAARWVLQLPGEQLMWIALMPTLGHAFSIFMGFHGGRALVTLFGAWSGLTLYELPLVIGGTAVISLFAFKNDRIRALIIPLAAIVYLMLRGQPLWMVWLGVGQLIIVLAKIGTYYLVASSASPSKT